MKIALGLMSGTSMDGIDLAILKTDGENIVETVAAMAVTYQQYQRERLGEIMKEAKNIKQRDDRPHSIKQGEVEITQWHCEAIEKFMEKQKVEVDVIGFHGQTVLHRPQESLTVQLGLGEVMAKRFNTDVIYDFRAKDMEMGGQGAPMACVYHRALCKNRDVELPAVIVNVGGIANATYIDENDELIAFDCGPGNCLIDQWMQRHTDKKFDDKGKEAKKGKIVMAVVEKILENSFFSSPPPKSADRTDFAPLLNEEISLADGARSLTYVTAMGIVNAQSHFPKNVKTWIVSGGGRHNEVLMADIKELVKTNDAKIVKTEEMKIDGDMMEAEAFAYLAVRAQMGMPLSYPTTTGCRKPTSGGVIVKA